MLIQDIQPGGKRPAPQVTALKKIQQIHHATKISTIASQPPQIRPELRKFSSFDILPAKARSVHQPGYMSNIRPQPNHPGSVKAHSQPPTQANPKPVVSNPVQPTPLQPAQPSAFQKHVSTPVITTAPRWRQLLDFVQYPLIAAIALLAAYNDAAGQIMIALYALFAIFVKVSSKYTFGAALLLLVAIPTFQALGESGVSEKCAIYAYELLVVGTLQAIVETWLDNRRNKVKHTTSRA